jgi:N-methylhydantoinase B
MMNTPTEKIEAEFPIRVLRHSLRRDSGGAGSHKGGDGQVREYLVLQDKVELTTMFERAVIPPYGLFGGMQGQAFNVTLQRQGEEEQPLKGVANHVLKANDRIVVRTSGGGGYGKPQQ